MKDNKLEVGDKIVSVVSIRWTNFIDYNFDEVERLTSTQAITKNGIRLKNEGRLSWADNKTIKFKEHKSGYDADNYQLVTDKILQDYNVEKHKQKVSNWFDKQKFTFEQKELIFNLLNNNNAS